MPPKKTTTKIATTKATSIASAREKITKKAEKSTVVKVVKEKAVKPTVANTTKVAKEKAVKSTVTNTTKVAKEKAVKPTVANTTKVAKEKAVKPTVANTTKVAKEKAVKPTVANTTKVAKEKAVKPTVANTTKVAKEKAVKPTVANTTKVAKEKAVKPTVANTTKISNSTSNTKTSTKQAKATKADKPVATATAKSSLKVVRVTVSTAENPAASKLAKKLNLPFNIGDYVFYPNEGVGHIIGTEDIVLEEKLTPYYVIRFSSQKMTNRIPIENFKKVKLRKIIGKSVANNVLKVFELEPPKSDLSWKDRLLVYQKINSKGNSIEMAEMLTALFFRKQARNNLSFQERQVFDFTLEAISSEIAVVLGITNQEANKEINTRLMATYQNAFELEEE